MIHLTEATEMTTVEEEGQEEVVRRRLEESLDLHPDDPSIHFKLGVLFWKRGEKSIAAEHLVKSAKLNPENGVTFRYLGDYYAHVSVDSQRALKCYQRAVTLNPDDSDAGEAMCDLLDQGGKESLEIAVCREASFKSPRAFWAFRRLGFLQVYQRKWSEAVQSLQHAIRGYPACADLWEALGLAYQQLGMFTAAIKSYGRATELENTRIFSLVESGNVSLMLGSFRKGIEFFRQALEISPQNIAACYGLASSLLGLAKECIDLGAFRWGASLLEEASEVTMTIMLLTGNISCIWKLHGDIQLLYAKSFPWMENGWGAKTDGRTLNDSIISWKRKRSLAAVSGCRSYQRALHLAPWEANLYTDIAIASDLSFYSEENHRGGLKTWSLSEKMCLGGLLLEGHNNESWVTLGCLSNHNVLKQHALIRGLQLDVSLAVAWAYLGKLYRQHGERQLGQQAFDRARSIDPSLALPWAGMSADADVRNLKPEEAYQCCLQAVQILPLAEFQIGIAKLALHSGHLASSEVFTAIQQALQLAPHYPESHNLNGLVCESRTDYQSAITSFRLARFALRSSEKHSKTFLKDISVNLARSLCKAGNASDAVQECETLKKQGQLDLEGLQIYASCLWQLGKGDMAVSATRAVGTSILSMEPRLAAAPTSFICRLIYSVLGLGSAITVILKMSKQLFENSKISLTTLAIHALDQNNQLESIVSSSCDSVDSSKDSSSIHLLRTLVELVKHASEDSLGIQNAMRYLRNELHLYPNSDVIRNLLGYLLVSSREWTDVHIATRCSVVDLYDHKKDDCVKSGFEIIGAGAAACYATGNLHEKIPFSTCRELRLFETEPILQLQKYLHQQPWNDNARYLLVLNYLQKARNERFPQHLCALLRRLICVALSNPLFLREDKSCEYKKFQLLLCASEVCLQCQNYISCIQHAKSASTLSLPGGYLFYAHLLLCRAFAAQDNFANLNREYMRCLELKTDYHVGWLCLKIIESQCKLQTNANVLALCYEECSKEIKNTWNMWNALFNLVQGLVASKMKDLVAAEEFLSQACSLAGDQSCLLLCHGTICMELARQQCDSHFLSLAVRSLKRARETSLLTLPIVSLLLAQSEGSLGSKVKWEKSLRHEWLSWPPEIRPAEIYFQMHLLCKQQRDGSSSFPVVEASQSPLRWNLHAIHLNPSCLRYWKVLLNSSGYRK